MSINDTYSICYTVSKKIIDEAVFIYRINNKSHNNFNICKCSVQQVVKKVKQSIEQRESIGFVYIIFTEEKTSKVILINVDEIMKQLN